MSFLSRHPRVRWAAPVLAAALTVGGVATAQSSAGGQSDLAPRSAHDLLVDLQHATPTPLSGTVVQTMDLGLPDLSSAGLGGRGGSSAGLSPVTLLSGSHTWRVWYADPTHARLALVDGTSEYDVVRHGSDLWQWSSTDRSVVHATVPDRAPGSSARTPAPTTAPGLPDLTDPGAVATWALAQLDPTTAVTSVRTDMVAGRAAYGLVLTPRSADTLIGSVHLSLDARTSLPLAATITPRGSTTPAVDVRYTRLTLGAPDASVFAFSPPPDATVTTPAPRKGSTADGGAPADRPRVVGTGWTSVVVGRLPAQEPAPSTTGTATNPLAMLERLLPRVSGTWGSGHLMSTRLFSVVLTDDGRFAAGAVTPPALTAALAR